MPHLAPPHPTSLANELGWVWLGFVGFGWARLGSVGLGWAWSWARLGSAGLGWTRLGSAGLGWAQLGWAELGWIWRLSSVGLDWVRGCARLGSAEPLLPAVDIDQMLGKHMESSRVGVCIVILTGIVGSRRFP